MGARILIIEDNPANSELVSYLLTAFGHTPIVADTGEEGLKMLREQRPDLVICDIHLPGMDGYEVVRTVKSDPGLRAIPCVAVTALAMVGDRERVLDAGFDGYLTKPIDPETFMTHVDDYLRLEMRASGVALASGAAAVGQAQATPVRATILVVDDRPVNLSLMRSILEPHGYRVLTASTVADGLRLARERKPDVIVSDLNIGAHTGYEFVAQARADPDLQDVPFILNTATDCTEEARRRGLALGATRFLFRPVEPVVLLAELGACLATKGKD